MAEPIPEPDHSPEGPTYEGRRLARPGEEIVDQGAGFDVQTLVSRRSVLGLVGLGIGATALAACGAESSTSTATTAAPIDFLQRVRGDPRRDRRPLPWRRLQRP